MRRCWLLGPGVGAGFPHTAARIPARRLEDNNAFRSLSPPMHFPAHEQKQALLDPVLAIAAERLPGPAADEARAFIARYYEQLDIEDLAARSAADLYGAAMAHLEFARVFASGSAKLRVYNPAAAE